MKRKKMMMDLKNLVLAQMKNLTMMQMIKKPLDQQLVLKTQIML